MAIEHDLPGFDELAAVLRRGPSDVVEEAPPDTLWAGIEAALAGEGRRDNRVVSLADRRAGRRSEWGRPVSIAVAAAAAVALVAVPMGLALQGGDDPSLTADLAALPGFESVSGEAAVTDGSLRIDVEGLEPVAGEYYEAWLLKLDDNGVADLVSLGIVAEADGTYTVPADIDLTEFDTVDISIEADDGDPSHSGKSVVRGQLDQA